MKLRQKLAMVLAAAMVVTAVPVTTMAASTNSFNKTLSIVADHKVTTGDSLFLTVKYDEKATEKITDVNGKDTFFINANDFKFDEDAYKDAWFEANLKKVGITITAKEDQLKVVVDSSVASTGAVDELEVDVPVIGTPKKGNPALTVDAEGSLATSGKYSLSTGAEVVTDKLLVAKAGDAKNISVEGFGTIADITIEETVADSLEGKEVTITLPNSSDLIFNSKYAKGLKVGEEVGTFETTVAKGKRGLNDTRVDVHYAYETEVKDGKTVVKSIDDKKIVVDFDNVVKTGTKGSLVLEDLEVQAEDKKDDVSTGEVKVTVKADKMEDTKLVVANVAEFGVAYTVDEVEELTAGQGSEKVKVKLKENAVDTLNKNREIYFKLENGYFVNTDISSDQEGFSFNVDGDEITLKLKDNADFEEGKINEFEFEVEIAAEATHEDAVVMVATSRNFEEDLKLEVAKITPAVEITAEPITVKAGLKDQVGGKIVIKETKEENLAKNKKIIIAADDAWGFEIEDAKIEVTDGDIKIDTDINKAGEIIITVERTSDEASEITISDIKVTTNRTVPEGSFDFLVGGTAISQNKNLDEDTSATKDDERFEDALTIENFIKVGTKNTEDLPNAAAAKEIVLTVGNPAYTVNGEAKTADAAAFIDASNRTMVPVRFVAEEFGKVDFGTINGVGTVTIFKDGAVLQFQNGSNIMNKNGINVPMDTQVVIKEGRTFVPFKYVADGLGINYSYDAATKSITFTNQAK